MERWRDFGSEREKGRKKTKDRYLREREREGEVGIIFLDSGRK